MTIKIINPETRQSCGTIEVGVPHHNPEVLVSVILTYNTTRNKGCVLELRSFREGGENAMGDLCYEVVQLAIDYFADYFNNNSKLFKID